MSARVVPERQVHGGRYDKPWIVRVNGQVLQDSRGGSRRYKTEAAASSAGWKAAGGMKGGGDVQA